MAAPVLLAATGVAEIELLHALESERDFTITRRCADGPELVAAATTGVGELAIISADFCPLDVDFLTTITVAECAIILLITSPDHAALARVAAEMGIAVAADVNEVIDAAHQWQRSTAEQAASIVDSDANPSGNVITVWGPAGAPGRTTLAIEIASHLAAANQRTLLIDADPYGGAIAPALGLLDEASGLIAATRAAGRGELGSDALLRHAVGIGPALRVLVGIPRPDRWPELTPVALEHVWKAARRGAQWTIIDCGFSLESDEELTFDTFAPQRNGATLSALNAADTVIAVGQADPMQIPRLVRGLSQLREAAAINDLVVAVTRVRASAAGARVNESTIEILNRYAGVPSAHLIPEDRESYDAALLHGKSVLETAPNSPATAAVAKLVEQLIQQRAAKIKPQAAMHSGVVAR